MKKHVIYDSEGVTYKDAKEILISEGYDADDITDDAIFEYKELYNGEYFNDERMNLNKTLDNDIIAIADLGLWNGRKSGYKVLKNNLNSILSCFCGDYIQVYYDGHNVKGTDAHHDGTNHYLFRQVKAGVNIDNLLDKLYNGTDAHHDGTNHYLFRQVKAGVNIDNLLDKLYNGTATRNDINNYTISLKRYVKEIYGWK